MRRTIEQDLPQDTAFLRTYDAFCERVGAIVGMPAATMDLLFRFLQQNGGRLSGLAREREFAAFTDEEATRTEGDLWRGVWWSLMMRARHSCEAPEIGNAV